MLVFPPVIVMAASSSIHGKNWILLVAAAWVVGVITTSVASTANTRLERLRAASALTAEGHVARAGLADPVVLAHFHARTRRSRSHTGAPAQA
jgi:hypothetical protein